VSTTAGEMLVSSTQVVNVGVELRRELERLAREEGRDVTSLARLIVRQYVEEHERGTQPD
jgi:hypothetical protein